MIYKAPRSIKNLGTLRGGGISLFRQRIVFVGVVVFLC